MNDHNLDELLKSARPPEREPGYWEYFPQRVTARLTGAPDADAAAPMSWAWRRIAGLAAICAVIALGVGLWVLRLRQPESAEAKLARYQKLYREVSALFPNQVQAIVADDQGVQLILADQPVAPSSRPVLVEICDTTRHCKDIITFSGQQVRANGRQLEVLVDGRGNVLVVGDRLLWSSETRQPTTSGLRVEATVL